MVRTRGNKEDSPDHDSEKGTSPARGSRDLTLASNWRNDPTTAEEMETWIRKTQRDLLDRLKFVNAQAENTKDATAIQVKWGQLNTYWDTTWLPQTNAETGTIYDDDQQKDMRSEMTKKNSTIKRMHTNRKTHDKHVTRIIASSMYEDFLYYQHPWNRRRQEEQKRGYDPKETPDERKQKQQAALKAWKDEDQEGRRYVHWRDRTVELMDHFEVGGKTYVGSGDRRGGGSDNGRHHESDDGSNDGGDNRGETVKVSPDNVIRYTSSVRELYRKDKGPVGEAEKGRAKNRKKHLRSWFPRRNFELDSDAFEQRQKEAEDESGFSNKAGTALSEGHRLHHGALETSYDQPTSFDTSRLGWTIRPFRKRVLPKTDDEGNKIEQEGVQYKKRKQVQTVEDFDLEVHPDGTVVGRNRDGEWAGRRVARQQEVDVPILDDNGNPVEDGTVHYLHHRVYEPGRPIEFMERVPGRREFSQARGLTPAEFSEDEKDGDDDGDGTHSSDEGGDSDDGSGDDNTDDEGDLFTQAYREGSKSTS